MADLREALARAELERAQAVEELMAARRELLQQAEAARQPSLRAERMEDLVGRILADRARLVAEVGRARDEAQAAGQLLAAAGANADSERSEFHRLLQQVEGERDEARARLSAAESRLARFEGSAAWRAVARVRRSGRPPGGGS